MMYRLHVSFALLVLACWLSPTQAQTTGKIAGVVTDTNGTPLPGVNVVIDGSTRGGATDVDGTYFILAVPSGTYDIAASAIGFETMRVTGVAVRVDRTTELDFELPDEAVGLGEVTVTASAALVEPDRTSASAKVSGDEIIALPVESFIDAVALQAGVTRGSGGSLHIRGGRSSEIKYYVDGVAVSNPFSNSLAVPVENTAVEEVEVISGTFNAEYGQANSGIVNIVTKSGADAFTGTFIGSAGGYLSGSDRAFNDIGEADLGGERYLEAALSGPLGLPRLSFFTNVKYTDRDGWLFGRRVFRPSDVSDFSESDPALWQIGATGDSSVVAMNPSTGLTNFFKLNYGLTRDIRLAYSVTRTFSKARAYNHRARLVPDYVPTQRSTSWNHLFSVNHVLNARTFYNIRLSAFTTDFSQYVYADPLDARYVDQLGPRNEPADVFLTGGVDRRWLDRSSVTYSVGADLTRQFGDAHLVKGGAEFRLHDLEFQEYELDGSSTLPDPSSNRNNSYTHQPYEIAVFLQDKIEIDDLIVNAGLRFDYFDANARVPTNIRDPQNILLQRPEDEAYRDAEAKLQLSPRLGFAFPITERGIIRASYGQFFQIPEFSTLYQNSEFEVSLGNFNTFIGNADLEPQRSTIYEVGLQQQLGQNFVIDVTGYYRDVRNLLGTGLYETVTGGDTFGRYENADFGNVRGITTAFSWRFTELGFRGSVNYTFQSVRGNGSDPQQAFFDARGDNEATRVLIPLDWDQRHNVAFDATYVRGTWSVGVLGEFVSGYPFTPVDILQGQIVELRNRARYDPEFRLDLRAARGVEFAGVTAQVLLVAENLLDFNRDDRFPQLLPSRVVEHVNAGRDAINTLPEFAYNPVVQPAPRSLRLGLQVDF